MSAGTPLVSVIIPAFNAERFLRQTLDSVLAQTYRNLEVIVVDDGSTDGTAALLVSYGNRVRYQYQENSGSCSKPRNAGFAVSSGELIAFIDADDLMAPERIAREVEAFVNHPDVGLVFTNYQDFGDVAPPVCGHFEKFPRLKALLERHGAPADPLILDSTGSTDLLLTENFGSSSPMVRRSVLDALGGYDQAFTPSDDFDFTYRVSSARTIALIPLVGWYKREHPTNMSANVPRVLQAKIRSRAKLLATEHVPRRRRTIERRLATWYYDLAYYFTGRSNRQALGYALASLRFRPWPFPRSFARLFLRLLLDVAGRDSQARA